MAATKCKMKTKRAAAKRYSVTGSGAVKVGRKGKRHLATMKPKKRKRQLRGTLLLQGADAAKAKTLIPYL